MTVLDFVNTAALVVIAASLALIAASFSRGVVHLASLSSLVAPVIRFLKDDEHDPDPHHHFAFAPTGKNLLVWEWKDGQWVLRPESGPLETAGPPPNRPGTFEGECVTSRRKG